MKVDIDVPVGVSGDWAVEEFEVSESAAKLANLRETMHGMGYRSVDPGKYKKLTRRGHLIMSNTRAEIDDFRWYLSDCKGKILINGLGLGVVLKMIADKEEVEHVTVIEKSEDVLKLVGPTFKDNKKIEIIHADAFEWKPPKGVKYNFVWHDIWDDICTDNIEGFTKLKRKYGKRCIRQACWCEEECRSHRYSY